MTRNSGDGLRRFLLLYASQTGQAKAIAEEIADTAPLYGLKADLHCLSLTDKRFSIEKENCVVFIVSTTGDGEPPDSAVKFYRRISRNSLSKDFLNSLNYTLLALGDSNYIKFCLFGRQLDQRLQKLSAKPFYPLGFGDDAFGIETGVDPWIQNLWGALQSQLSVDTSNSCTVNCTNLNSNLSEGRTSAKYLTEMDLMTEQDIKHFTLKKLLSQREFYIEKCRFPKLPSKNLSVNFKDIKTGKCFFFPNEGTLPSQDSSLSEVSLLSAKKLTYGNDVKSSFELTFQFQNKSIPYRPGDSFGFICKNPLDEVKLILKKCGVIDYAERIVQLELPEDVRGKRKLPSHICSDMSLIDIFLNCIEIRSVPKKILLRVLAEYTAEETEKNVLLFLSSPEGSKFYTQCIRKPSVCVLDILMQFTSCKPPVEVLMEYLPNLKPRFYSVASTPLKKSNEFKIVFNVLEIPKGEGRSDDREGVCTGWFRRISEDLLKSKEANTSLENQLNNLTLNESIDTLLVYKRTNHHFFLPENVDTPLIMVGPGTGIAPFIGFLQHREQLKVKETSDKMVNTWLFYGCRFADKDFLYRTELYRLKSSGVLSHLYVSHSREPNLPPDVASRYVHENIKLNGAAVADAMKAGARIYICGDAKHMAHDVQQSFIDCFQEHSGLSDDDSKSFVEKLQAEHKYLNDVWA